MRFVEEPNLNRLSVLLRHFDAGDRILKGCIELFSTREKPQEEDRIIKKMGDILSDKESDAWLSKSPLGPMKKGEVKDLLAGLLSAMNQCYPDYDFSSLNADQFSRKYDFAEVYNNINYHLAFFVERCLPGFLEDLWSAIRGVVDFANVEIYSCSDPFFDESGLLFSFDYFFHDRKAHRMLFLSCVTTSKCSSPDSGNSPVDSSDEENEEFSFSDVSSSEDVDANKSPICRSPSQIASPEAA